MTHSMWLSRFYFAVIFIVIGLFCAPARSDELTAQDIKLELVLDLTLVADYAQTMGIKNTPSHHEVNVVLGRHPSNVRIRNYFLSCAVGYALITKALPSEYRPAWQYGVILLELVTGIHNRRVGASFTFK